MFTITWAFFMPFSHKGQTCTASFTGTSNNSNKRTGSNELSSLDWPYFPEITETSQPVTMLQSETCLHQWACCSPENMSSSQFFMLIIGNLHMQTRLQREHTLKVHICRYYRAVHICLFSGYRNIWLCIELTDIPNKACIVEKWCL